MRSASESGAPSLVSAARSPSTLPDPLEEAARILDAAEGAGLLLRAAGGVGVALIAPSARRPPLARPYQDIDFVTRHADRAAVALFLAELGYQPETAFNALHGQTRQFFLDPAHRREVDVFIDRIAMCHAIELVDRLALVERTLTPVDLLMSKLQVVETNDKDLVDVVALLTDLPVTEDETGINLDYLARRCAADWGLWRTATLVLERTEAYVRRLPQPSRHSRVLEALGTIGLRLDSEPKSRRWKLRARVGEHVRWYEQPEEVEHD